MLSLSKDFHKITISKFFIVSDVKSLASQTTCRSELVPTEFHFPGVAWSNIIAANDLVWGLKGWPEAQFV